MNLDLWPNDTAHSREIALPLTGIVRLFNTPRIAIAKVGILTASLISGIGGALVLSKAGTARIRLDSTTS